MAGRIQVAFLLAVGAVISTWLQPAIAAAQMKVVEVRVEGNEVLSDGAVLANVKTRVGENYSEKIVTEDVRRLLLTGRFSRVEATRTPAADGMIVTFHVAERPVVAKLAFVGNKELKDEDLLGHLSFAAQDPLNLSAVENGRESILTAYRSRGYYFATVKYDRSAVVKKREVVYEIVEGPRVHISRIRFEGNTYFHGLQLRMKIGSAQRFWPFTTGQLDLEQVARDVSALRSYYVEEGFLDAEVGYRLEFSDDKKKVILTFLIEQRQRYRVNRIIFRGNVVYSDAVLRGRLSLSRGKFLTALKLRRDTQALINTYGESGYIEATVVAKRQYVDPTAPPPEWARHLDAGKPALVNIIFEIEEKDQYTVGRIIIRGNTLTQARVIRRELRFYPEQLFNTVAVEESRKRLRETWLFEDVTITPTGKAPGVRNALVQVKEGKTAEFLAGVGISSNSGLLGTISFTQRNFDILGWPKQWKQFTTGEAFKGAGQVFRIVAEPGLSMSRFHIQWTEPYIFDLPYSLDTKGFYFTRGRESYDETRYGGVVSVGHRFKNRWYGEVSSRAEGVKLDDFDWDTAPEITTDGGTTALVGIKGTLVRDRTDSRWMPSRGDRFRVSYEQVAGDFTFGRATGEYRIYRTLYVDPLDRKHILAGRVAGGYICGDAPVFERFYGGGIGSVRGFEYRGISPRSAAVFSDDPIGGDFLVFAGAEYSFPLLGDQLRGVVFLDSGTVEDTFTVTTYRVSAGFGIRWIIPLFGPVPMSFDFGFPLNKDDEDDTQIFSFSLGFTF